LVTGFHFIKKAMKRADPLSLSLTPAKTHLLHSLSEKELVLIGSSLDLLVYLKTSA
jgi:hypothetical protein